MYEDLSNKLSHLEILDKMDSVVECVKACPAVYLTSVNPVGKSLLVPFKLSKEFPDRRVIIVFPTKYSLTAYRATMYFLRENNESVHYLAGGASEISEDSLPVGRLIGMTAERAITSGLLSCKNALFIIDDSFSSRCDVSVVKAKMMARILDKEDVRVVCMSSIPCDEEKLFWNNVGVHVHV